MTRAAMAGAARLRRYCSRPDWLLTAAALVIMLSTSVAGDSWQLPAGWAAVVVVLSWLPLTVRASWPLPVLAAVLAADTVHIALAGHAHPAAGTLPAATMLALYTVATRYPARVAWTAAAAAGVIQFTVALVSYPHAGPDLLYLNWAVVATALGLLIRERRERIAAAEQRAEAAEHSKQAEADRQVTAERIRIAHELHDVLAHHIAVVNAQAGVAQYLLRTDPPPPIPRSPASPPTAGPHSTSYGQPSGYCARKATPRRATPAPPPRRSSTSAGSWTVSLTPACGSPSPSTANPAP